jgi:hypothetical protein
MRRKTIAVAGAAVVVAVAFFFFAPVVYSPTIVYGSLHLNVYPTYPNWQSLSCWAFGYGVHYGQEARMVPATFGNEFSGTAANAWTIQYSNATQFGCPPISTSLP